MEGWTDFAVAAAGATAALAGLVIVAISVNVREILRYAPLVPRAGVTIAALIVALLAALSLLVPQPTEAIGVELLLFTAPAVWALARAILVDVRGTEYRTVSRIAGNAVPSALWVLSFLVSGILLLAGATAAGLYVVAAAIALAVIAAVVNTWVLLIEILR